MARITIQRNDANAVVFDPDPIAITTGLESVFWFNADTKTHSIALDAWSSGGDTSSIAVNPDHSSSQVNITTAGSYGYHCTLHDNETGTITAT